VQTAVQDYPLAQVEIGIVMNLDDLERFRQLDSLNMLAEIDNLPSQLQTAWDLGQTLPLPAIPAEGFSRMIVIGMGGSAIGGDLLASWAEAKAVIPIAVYRDYGLPAYARGQDTLVVASSHSGNTEETLNAFDVALQTNCTPLAVTTGGELAKRARQSNVPLWMFEHGGQPRAAVGFSFGLLLALVARLRLIPPPEKELVEAISAMQELQESCRAEVPAALNPAKRCAGQLLGRWVTVFGAGIMAPVARRIKTQINEVAKAGANFEVIPEADHNTLAGTMQPEEVLLPRTMNLFLRSPSDHRRNRKRLDLTRKAFMLEGLNTDFLDARGRSSLSHMWTTLLFGDYLAYYLAMGYGVDPTPVTALVNLKDSLRE
jgi:glucose/mannose-6-phosphate isomerase